MIAKIISKKFFITARLSLIVFILLTACAFTHVPPADAMDKGVGGLEALPQEDLLAENILLNPGFEDGVNGWSYIGACFDIDDAVSRSGIKSLRFNAGDGCKYVRQLELKPGTTSYTIRGWVNMKNVNPEGQVLFYLFEQTHSGMAIEAIREKAVDTAAGWKFFELKNIDVSPRHKDDTIEFRIATNGVTSGQIWFDDLEVLPQYKPLRVFVTYPNFRGYLWDDKKQVIEGVVEVNNLPGKDLKDMRLILSLRNATTNRVFKRTYIVNVNAENPFSFDTSSLSNGEYLLAALLYDKARGVVVERYPDYRIVKTGAASRDVLNNWIDENNVLHHNGKPRFVWGVYDRISGTYRAPNGAVFCDQGDYETKIKGFDGLKLMDSYLDSGVNTVLNFVQFSGANPGVDGRCSQINPYVAALDARNIMHLQVVNNFYGLDDESCYGPNPYRPLWGKNMSDVELWETISSVITEKGLLGYYTADEPGVASPVTLCGVSKQYQVLKERDKGTITYEVFLNVAHPKRWFDSADVFATDPYPLGGGPVPDDVLYGETDLRDRRHLPRSYGWTVDTVDAVKGSRPVWQVLQLFRFGGKFPNYKEMKQQTWKAIIGGADGILWWGFVYSVGMEDEWYDKGNHQAYYDFKRISEEVMALEGILITPDVTGLVSTSNPNIAFIVKKASPGNYVVMATNKTEVDQNGITFAVNATIGSLSLYKESGNVLVFGNTFTDNFGPDDVHIYNLRINGDY